MSVKKGVLGFFGLFLLVALGLFVIQQAHFGGITGFIIFEDSSSDFASGTFENTSYNGSAVVLSGTNTTGSFTSAVFNATQTAIWNDISWIFSGNALLYVRSCDDIFCENDSWNQLIIDASSELDIEDSTFVQYRVDLTTGAALYNVSIDYDLDSSAPELVLVSPQHGSVYGYNSSLPLEYTSDDDLDSCWYSLSDVNISLPSCSNITIDLSEGEHTIYVYANNSLGIEGFTTSTFNVSLDYPTIILESPRNEDVLNDTVIMEYYVNDSDLQYCDLLADFSGSFSVNDSEEEPVSGAVNSFSQDLGDGTYSWSIECVDDSDQSSLTDTWSFAVDSVAPNVGVSQPTGTFSSRREIPLTLSVSDESVVQCTYSVKDSQNTLLFSLTLGTCQSTSFNVPRDGSYTVDLSFVDEAGNAHSDSATFIVDSSPDEEDNDDENEENEENEEEDEGELSISVGSAPVVSELSYTDVPSFEIRQGSARNMSVELINSGSSFLNGCSLGSSGAFDGWIQSDELFDLSPGEEGNYAFTLVIPLDAHPSNALLPLYVSCDEVTSTVLLNFDVREADFIFTFSRYERIPDALDVYYILASRSEEQRVISIDYVLLNLDGTIVSSGQENSTTSEDEQILRVSIPKDAFGEFQLVFDLAGENDMVSVTEPILLPAGGVTGFAISDSNRRTLTIWGVLIMGLLASLLVIRFVHVHNKKISAGVEKREFIPLQPADDTANI